MSVIVAASELIRRASTDSLAQQRLDVAADDPDTRESLVFAPVRSEDLRWLSTSEWLWFATWRQHRGGRLDPLILERLRAINMTGSRFARFEFRGLIFRDPETQQLAREAMSRRDVFDQTGLDWILDHCREFTNPREIARDALQYGTEASWFALRVINDMPDRSADPVRRTLATLSSRQVDDRMVQRWTFQG
ncbi:hypothetical protein [Nocardioides sp. Leaf285]|uniref:hypothetical protein n=1 Tax=Nocardioides sp. Leaf285 TaxID=1736322 RepID=UPI0007034B91|nr:hypothetical protein [Nocardioides sp. Leaf285]KQP63740.1 hypothetical protein ASF47_17275 [Nocardioides sp. Leaf285]